MKARQLIDEVVQSSGAAPTAGPAKIVMHMSAKCADMFTANFTDAAGNSLGEYDGYVPDFMPGEHFGDYVQLDIDLNTGRILNWRAPQASAVRALFGKQT